MRFRSSSVALILVDSASDQHVYASRVLMPVLEFWGVPMALIDVAKPPARLPAPSEIGVILLLQEGLSAARLSSLASTLTGATVAGAGVVICDPGIDVEATRPGQPLRFAQRSWDAVKPVQRTTVVAGNHFVTQVQRAYREFNFRKPVPALPTAIRDRETVLLSDDAGEALLTVENGPVRIARWLLSNWVWSEDFFGFGRGMDALFWRTMLWAARKPFAIAAFPPYGRFRLDDCRGLWRTPHDLQFLDVMKEFGEVANLGVCLSAPTDEGWKLLAERAKRGEIEVSPHVQAPDVGVYNVADEEAASPGADPLADHTRDLFHQHECPMAKSVSDHNHELSSRGVRIASQLGMTSRMNVMRLGERWETVHRRWRPAPFGCMHYALDRFVDAPELFTAINHHASFSDSFLALPEDRFLCTAFGGFTDDRWDFLNGHVTANHRNLDAALERLLRHAELALTSLFFAGSISHTHFTRYLTNDDWRFLLSGYRKYADQHGYRPLGYDAIAAFAVKRMAQGYVDIEPGSVDGDTWALVATDGIGGCSIVWQRASQARVKRLTR
jgi:hypothetical protein